MAKGINLDGSIVSARDDAFIYNALAGKSGIYNYGNKFTQVVVSANLIRIKDGIALLQGRNYVIYPSETVDVTIDNGTQGTKRNDIIVVEFERTSSKETITIKVVKGTPVSSGNAADPALTQQDTLASGTKYQLPLYRVRLDGINISAVNDLRIYIPSLSKSIQFISDTEDYVEVEFYK